MRPVIGITPLMDTKLDSYWMLPDYMQAVQQAGGLPLMLPFQYDDESIDQMVELCDGLIFTGGEDIDPSRYHEERLPVCGESIPIRDELEIRLLRAALAAKKPVLCICRGLQLFNVVMGGTLWQDLPSQRPSEIKHSQGKPYGAATHSVELVPGSPLHALLGQSTIGVNTRHHQAIRELAPSLAVMATSPDGLIESICLPGSRFAWGVQWHPEHMAPDDANSVKIFAAFVEACID